MKTLILKKRIKTLITFFVVSLVISGLTAIPLLYELIILDDLSEKLIGPNHPLSIWISKVLESIKYNDLQYPFVAYGTDWLAFAHIVIAVAFIGPLIDPVKNKWVIKFGMIACAMVIPFALIAGEFRGIPLFWRSIDCMFGIVGFIPLWISYRYINQLEKQYGESELKKNFNLKFLLILCLLTFISFYLVESRIMISESRKYTFLLWNLLLAFLPLLFSFLSSNLMERKSFPGKIYLTGLLGLWLLFFPNAPYMLTDFIHLKNNGLFPLWLDFLLISCFAAAAFMSGLLSLKFAYHSFMSLITVPEYLFLVISSFLGGFGVYLGRFLRWNSWDIFKNPLKCFIEGIYNLSNPFALITALFFTLILFSSYMLVKKIAEREYFGSF